MNFYSRLPALFVVTKTGTKLQFSAGVYATEDKEEIALLQEVLKINPGMVSLMPRPLVKNDAIALRDVGTSRPKQGVGMVSSAALAALVQDSNSKA